MELRHKVVMYETEVQDCEEEEGANADSQVEAQIMETVDKDRRPETAEPGLADSGSASRGSTAS